MSTSAIASAVFPLPLEIVWSQLRDFTFPKKLLPTIVESIELEGENVDGRTVGVIRNMVWKTGEKRKHRLLSVSDQYHSMSWELIDADPPVETSAAISRLKCYRVSEVNQTVVEWSAEYSSDVPSSFVIFEQKSFQENLAEIRTILTGKKLPILYHMNEAPSSRVLWLAYELGIPLNVKEVLPAPTDLRKSRETEVPAEKGGMVTSYVEDDLVLLESGAVVMHLLEQFDTSGRLAPPVGTKERALFHKFLFYSSSTADHLLFQAYKLIYVLDEGEYGDATLETLKDQWDHDVALNFTKQLESTGYICGDNFTAADIMIGWTFYIANLLNWLDGHPVLLKYFQRISKRAGFQRFFNTFQW